MNNEEREKILAEATAKINKQFGPGTIKSMRDKEEVPVVSSGIPMLDVATGGGMPRGRIVEIYGPESSGKSTLALHLIAEVQRSGGKCAYIDSEHALDPFYAADLGVDVDDILLSQPDTAEQALAIVEELTKTGAVEVIVVDSVAAMVPRAELEGEMGDSHMGLMARLMSQALRKITGNVAKTGTIVYFINQLRMKIGVVFGNPEVTSGGNALKFYSSVRMDIRKTGQIKDGDEIIGQSVKVKVVKNKIAPPFKIAEFDIEYGKGASLEGQIVDLGVAKGILKKSGAWFSYNGENIGQGRDNTKKFLLEHPDTRDEIYTKVRAAYELR